MVVYMRLIAYGFLIFLAIIFDVVQVISHWRINWILFFSGIFVLIITLFLAFLHMVKEEDWQLKWALLYTIPAGLLMFGGVADYFDFQNQVLMDAGQKSISSLIPGNLSDYEGAVISHFTSMIFPFIARALSVVIEFVMELTGLTK